MSKSLEENTLNPTSFFMNVLIVDDNVDVLESLNMILKSLDCKTTLASNGVTAKDLLSRFSFDIVVCDFLMPDLDGYELLKWLRNRNKDIYFVIISGFTNQSFTKQFQQHDVDTILLKPFQKKDIESILIKAREKIFAPKKQITQFNEGNSEKSKNRSGLNAQPIVSTIKDKLQGLLFIAIMESPDQCIIDQSLHSKILLKVLYKTSNEIIDTVLKQSNINTLKNEVSLSLTTTSQIHYIKLLGDSGRFLYLIVSKENSNLNLIKLIIDRYKNELEQLSLENN